MLLFHFFVLVFSTSSAISAIITTPGVQRKSLLETCLFQWSVSGPISRYSVSNQTLGYSASLNPNANYTLDSQTGVITLTIRDIQLWDAGNYSLSLTTGITTESNADALLFVFGNSESFVNQTYGVRPPPALEGDTIELTCIVISTSLPVTYRPRIYYYWYLSYYGYLQNISSGPAMKDNGDLLPGYSIKNDGRTLVIDSAQYRDTQGIFCNGREEWSPFTSSPTSFYFLSLNYRPYIYSRTPVSGKFNAEKGNLVSLLFYFSATPAITSATNWSFVNSAGHSKDLSDDTSSYYWSYQRYLIFNFTSEEYYGTYSITLYNSIGSTTETFQVLRPGPSDTPSNVRVDYVSHYLIAIAWNCMWFNGRPQKTFLQLKALDNDRVIDSLNTSLSNDCYNSTQTTQFKNGLQPETDYMVSVWSNNDLGSSDIVPLVVKTAKKFKFAVSPKKIYINGNQAIINFNATDGVTFAIYTTCCDELTGICHSANFYDMKNTVRQVQIYDLPTGNVYVFDFIVYGRDSSGNMYYLAMVKGVKVSRTGESELEVYPDCVKDVEKANPLLIPVIVLGVLLGVAVLALIGCFIAFVVCKRHQPNNSQLVQQPNTRRNARTPQPTPERKNEAYEREEDTYETVDGNPSKDDTNYTALQANGYA